MINLIKKDLFLTWGNLILNIVFLLLIWGPISLLSVDKFTFLMIFTIANLILATMNMEIGSMMEISYNINMVMASLPLRRGNVVISKYLVSFLSQMLYCIILYVYIQFLSKYTNLGALMTIRVGFEVIFFSLAACLIYISASIPLYYKYRSNARAIGFVLEAVIIAIPGYLLKNYIKPDNLMVLNSLTYSLIVSIISIIIYLISIKISVRIYDKLEY